MTRVTPCLLTEQVVPKLHQLSSSFGSFYLAESALSKKSYLGHFYLGVKGASAKTEAGTIQLAENITSRTLEMARVPSCWTVQETQAVTLCHLGDELWCGEMRGKTVQGEVIKGAKEQRGQQMVNRESGDICGAPKRRSLEPPGQWTALAFGQRH